jgi:cytochrome oxidase Cu insertion factor (SCO1/SenC/PrrC family)
MQWRLPSFLTIFGLVMIAGCARPNASVSRTKPSGPPGVGVNTGQIAPQIEGEDIDGKHFKLSDYKGKVVLLDFWATW